MTLFLSKLLGVLLPPGVPRCGDRSGPQRCPGGWSRQAL